MLQTNSAEKTNQTSHLVFTRGQRWGSNPEVQVLIHGTLDISCCKNIMDILHLRLLLEWMEFRWKSRSPVTAVLSTLKKSLLGNIHEHFVKSDAITKHNAKEVQALCYLKFLHHSKQWDLFSGKLFGALCWFQWWWESIWPVSRGVRCDLSSIVSQQSPTSVAR